MAHRFLVAIIFTTFSTFCFPQQVDVLVIGGGASGTTAGIQAARMGVKTLITEETTWLGGMLTSAGVSAIDGNYKLPAGIFGEFRDSLELHYGSAKALQTGWVSNILFEPSVGNKILKSMVRQEKNLSVWYKTEFLSAKRNSNGWIVILKKDNKKYTVKTKILIDATELGDVAKFCGVKYDIGMEAKTICGEGIAPEKANNIVQDLTYVMILKDYRKNVTISKPVDYNPALFSCTAQSANCTKPKPGQTVYPTEKMIQYGKLQNGKYMINWPIEGNDYYVNLIEMSDNERKKALEKAKQFSLCYLYYLQTELGLSNFGLAEDEFPTKDRLPMIPYHRESRRIRGLIRFNVNDIAKPFSQNDALYRTGIAVGDYPIDHHHKRYPDCDKLPNLHFYPVPSYSLPLGTLIPQNVDGLIVAEKSISVSNLVNGSTRLQPVVMQIGQAAGALAAIAVKQNKAIKNIAARDVQTVILNANGYLLPYLDLKKEDVHFKALQRIGATGILKGIGKNAGWNNETWFNADSTVLVSELKQGLFDFDSKFKFDCATQTISIAQAIDILNEMTTFYQKQPFDSKNGDVQWKKLQLTQFDPRRAITRKEFAALLDAFVNPFSLKAIDIRGKFIEQKPNK